MKSGHIIGIIAILIIGGGIVWYVAGATPAAAPTQDMSGTASTTGMEQGTAPTTGTVTTKTTTTTTTTQSSPAAQHFTVNGNDQTADLKVITVAPGTPVTITFGADAGTTYHGGLDYRSSVMNTGTIVPGSTKTITFTATKSFSFTPYWPATNIAKPYTIDIVVK